MGKSVPSPPEPPDPYKTAQAQTGSNIATGISNTYLGNANERGPFGNVTYDQTGTGTVREINRDKDGNPITQRRWVADPGGTETFQGTVTTPGHSIIDAATGQPIEMGGSSTTQTGGTPGERGRWVDEPSYTEYEIPRFTRTTTLSPEQQAIYDRQTRAQTGLLDLGNSQIDRLQRTLSEPFNLNWVSPRTTRINVDDLPMMRYGVDLAGLPGIQTSIQRGNLNDAVTSVGSLDDFAPERQRVEDALMQRMNPTLQNERARMEAQLVNQGFTRGSEAFTSQMQDFGRQENDARMAAILAAGQEQNRLLEGRLASGTFANTARSMLFGENVTDAQFGNAARSQRFAEEASNVGMSNAARAQQVQERLELETFANAQREAQIQEQAMIRNQPINEISALLGQTQVQAPQFTGYRPGQIQNTPVGDYVYKTADIESRNYQAELQAQAAANGGMFGLGSSLLGGLFRLSDRKAKTDIRKVGKLDNGLPVYAYRYKHGGPVEIGLMADEVEAVNPAAVTSLNGFKMVDYGRAAHG